MCWGPLYSSAWAWALVRHDGLLLFGIQLYREIYWINQRGAQIIPLASGLLASNEPKPFSFLLFSNTLWRVSQAPPPDHLVPAKYLLLHVMGLQAKPPATLSCMCSVDSSHTLPGYCHPEAVWRCGWPGSGSLLRALAFVLITVAFLRNWQITGYLARWTNLLSFLLSLLFLSFPL